jgi:prephenate dehydrogenase
MGGSLALAARSRAGVEEVVGYDPDVSALNEAFESGVITEKAGSAAEAAAYADLVVVAAPVRSIPELVEECAAAEPRPRLITDLGSTKAAIVEGLSPLARSIFIGGHPMSGGASSGARFARADLFDGTTYFLCTSGGAYPKLYEMLQTFVTEIGARPTHIDAEVHDRMMAAVSHLPHVMANILMEYAGNFEAGGRKAIHWAGPSFKDLTRIAGANPPMWRDIFLENREALAAAVASVSSGLDDFRRYLESADQAEIEKEISSAAALRKELLEHEDIAVATLYKVTARISDKPGELSRVMVALGDASINVEDLTLHHVSRSQGGDLVMYVDGEEVADKTRALLTSLGFATVVDFSGEALG